jgi:hypothetical protein
MDQCYLLALSVDLLISSWMDVVIIVAKLVCHLCCVCKLVYFSSVPSSERRKKKDRETMKNEEL